MNAARERYRVITEGKRAGLLDMRAGAVEWEGGREAGLRFLERERPDLE